MTRQAGGARERVPAEVFCRWWGVKVERECSWQVARGGEKMLADHQEEREPRETKQRRSDRKRQS
jgi:hypothetical protein